MKNHLIVACLLLLITAPARSQQQGRREISGYGGGVDERAAARVLYWNMKEDIPAGQFVFDYGRPVWNQKYEDPAKFDAMTKGKVWRMGNNFWTLLDTSLPLKISGKNVSVGYYYLGLRRSQDGAEWSLAFIDPAKVRLARLDGFVIDEATVEFEAPVSVEKNAAITEKLTITLTYTEDAPTKVIMRLAWGNLLVTAPIEASLLP